MQNNAIYHISCEFVDMSLLHMLQCRSNASKIWDNTLHLSITLLRRPSYLSNTYDLRYFVAIDHVERRHVLYNFECNLFMFVTSLCYVSHVPFENIRTKHDIHTSTHEHRGVESGPFGSGKLNIKTRQWPHAKTFSFTVKLVSHCEGTTSLMLLSCGTLVVDWKA
jgi:hypothetical protein